MALLVLGVQVPLLLALSTFGEGAFSAFEGFAGVALISRSTSGAFSTTAGGTFTLIVLEELISAGCAFSGRASHTVGILAGFAGLGINAGSASSTAWSALVGFFIKEEASFAGSADVSTSAGLAFSCAGSAGLVFGQVEFVVTSLAFSGGALVTVSSRAGIAGLVIAAGSASSTTVSADGILWEEVSLTLVAGVLGAIFTVVILACSALFSIFASLAGSTASSASTLLNEPTIRAGCASVNVLTAFFASSVLISAWSALGSVFINTESSFTFGTLINGLVLAVLNSSEGVLSNQSEQKSE